LEARDPEVMDDPILLEELDLKFGRKESKEKEIKE